MPSQQEAKVKAYLAKYSEKGLLVEDPIYAPGLELEGVEFLPTDNLVEDLIQVPFGMYDKKNPNSKMIADVIVKLLELNQDVVGLEWAMNEDKVKIQVHRGLNRSYPTTLDDKEGLSRMLFAVIRSRPFPSKIKWFLPEKRLRMQYISQV